MRFPRLFSGLFLLTLVLVPRTAAQEAAEPAEEGPPPASDAPVLPGFVHIPAGAIQPGTTLENVNARAIDPVLRAAIQYDQWSDAIPGVPLPAYFIQRYELTNAQWKVYLDRNFRETHTTGESETLRSIAANHIRYRDEGVEEEWRAIYALNWSKIYVALKESGGWKDTWTPATPGDDPGRGDDLGSVILPKGLELHFWAHRTPRPWYGWCSLAHLRVGKEVCDIDKAPAEAFIVPEGEMFLEARLRATDFAACPVRDVSPNELFAFAEWAGCTLPSEYEWERAARGDRPNSQQFTGQGAWDHNAEPGIVATGDNRAAVPGPLPVDAETVRKSDSPFGARHMLGNVWELTRTFWDFHPRVAPAPPPPEHGLFNYALVAKGASFGDTWRLVAVSSRTGWWGKDSILDLQYNNRIDSVGARLVRHPRAAEDLLRHSLLRLTYDRGRGRWTEPLPHAYNFGRMVGVDAVHIVESESPYMHVQDGAKGIGFLPLHLTRLDSSRRKEIEQKWKAKHPDSKRDYEILGVLRSDVPLVAGVRLRPQEARELREQRAEYERIEKEIEKRNRRPRGRKKDDEEELVLPPKPPEVSAYEEATERNEENGGLWVEGSIPAGEWIVVYWGGFIGLANRSLLMPPDAIILLDTPRKDLDERLLTERSPLKDLEMSLEPEKDRFVIQGSLEIDPATRNAPQPPDQQESQMWALCETLPQGWPGRPEAKYCWDIKVTFRTPEGAMKGVNWTK